MERSKAVTGDRGLRAANVIGTCPRCEEAFDASPAVAVAWLDGVFLRRCPRCATRSVDGSAETFAFSCRDCGLPFLSTELLPHTRHRCDACRSGIVPAGLPDATLADAMEREALGALDRIWRFVSHPGCDRYLDTVAASIAARIEGAPLEPRVILFDEATVRTLAMPSGTILVSTGALGTLGDEAELAFVLGHELAHAASRDAETRMMRVGLHLALEQEPSHAAVRWSGAMLDLVRLGYGRDRERDADRQAIEATAALGYDATAAQRYLHRIGVRTERGEIDVAELALAHPPARDRIERAERTLARRSLDDVGRVNREVFRRVVGQAAEGVGLIDVGPSARLAPAPTTPRGDRGTPREVGPLGVRLAFVAFAVVVLVLTLVGIIGSAVGADIPFLLP